MKVTVGENGDIELKELFVGATLIGEDGTRIGVASRDGSFEFYYNNKMYVVVDGVIKKYDKDLVEVVDELRLVGISKSKAIDLATEAKNNTNQV